MWNRRLVEPVVLDNGEVLRTLRDAQTFIAALPEQHQRYRKWRTLANCLFSEDMDGAAINLRRALAEAGFDPQ